jgi:hypothetical protein
LAVRLREEEEENENVYLPYHPYLGRVGLRREGGDRRASKRRTRLAVVCVRSEKLKPLVAAAAATTATRSAEARQVSRRSSNKIDY